MWLNSLVAVEYVEGIDEAVAYCVVRPRKGVSDCNSMEAIRNPGWTAWNYIGGILVDKIKG